jgi:hypothetical protein
MKKNWGQKSRDTIPLMMFESSAPSQRFLNLKQQENLREEIVNFESSTATLQNCAGISIFIMLYSKNVFKLWIGMFPKNPKSNYEVIWRTK